jgi:hypothetical protein
MTQLLFSCRWIGRRGVGMANEDRIMAVYMMANRKQGALYTG